MQACLLRLNV